APPGPCLVVLARGPGPAAVLRRAREGGPRPRTRRRVGVLPVQPGGGHPGGRVFNLLPALPLDGGHMLRAVVWRFSGDENRGTIVAARSGQVLAVLVLIVPFVLTGGDPGVFALVWAALVAMLLWSGATLALAVGRWRSSRPGYDV